MRLRRSPGLERVLRLAALAFPMAQDAVDDPHVCNKRDDLHAGAALAKERVCFEDFPQKASPQASGFPGGVGIVLAEMSVYCGTAAGARR
jgi:hypothetical protein